MNKRDATELWEEMLRLACGADAEAVIRNPALTFTRNAKDGKYDKLSDEDYGVIREAVDEFSYFWRDQPDATPRDLLCRLLQTTDIPKSTLCGIAAELAECSARTRYGSPWLDPVNDARAFNLTCSHDPAGRSSAWTFSPEFPDEPAPCPAEATPKHIYKNLCKDVYSQEDACRAAAIIMYKHLNGQRTNALFQGPTGCGKSEIWRSMSKMFPGKVRMVDFSRISGDGWSGSMHMRDVFEGVSKEQLAGEGVVLVLDEADKIVGETAVGGGGTNYNGIVQNQLLKLLDGDTIEFGPEKERGALKVDCSHVSVVMLGAFENLMNARKASKTIGFGSESLDAGGNDPVEYDELVRSGMRREIAGRIQTLVHVRPLEQSDYERILTGRILKDPRTVGKLDASMSRKDAAALAADAFRAKLGVRWMSSRVADAVDALMFDHPDAEACRLLYPPCAAEVLVAKQVAMRKVAQARAAARRRTEPAASAGMQASKEREEDDANHGDRA